MQKWTSTPPTTEEIRQYTGSPGTAPTRHKDANPFVVLGRAWGKGGAPTRHKEANPFVVPGCAWEKGGMKHSDAGGNCLEKR